MRVIVHMLALTLASVACRAASADVDTTKPECGPSSELALFHGYFALLEVGEPGPRTLTDGREVVAREIVGREIVVLPTLFDPRADVVDVRWLVAPDLSDSLSASVGDVRREVPLDALHTSLDAWVEHPADLGRGRLVAPHDPDRIDVLAAARARHEGRAAPSLSELHCTAGWVDGLAQYHAWSLQVAGTVGDEEVSAALPIVFETATAFAPGGASSSFRWEHGDYRLRGTAWLAATPSEVVRSDVIVRLRIEDDDGHVYDASAGLVGGVARGPGPDDAWGLGNLEVDLHDFAGDRRENYDARAASIQLDFAPQARLTVSLPSVIVVDHETVPGR